VSNANKPSRTSATDAALPPDKASGRASFDERGNAVWEWQTEEGEFSQDVDTQRLRTLQAPELSLEEPALTTTDRSPQRPGPMHNGCNPYDKVASPADRKPTVKSIQSKFAAKRKP
jgi:hypothetical protein